MVRYHWYTMFYRYAMHGVTLVELMVVIAIIGIFASVTMNSMTTPRTDARDKSRVTDLKRIGLALDLYKSTCHQYPRELTLTVGQGCPVGTTLDSFLTTLPIDPQGNSYGYATSSTGLRYMVRATLESTSTALSTDIDGTVNYGVSLDCSDSPTKYYCITS